MALQIHHNMASRALNGFHRGCDVGRIDEAEELTAELDASSAALGLPWATAMAVEQLAHPDAFDAWREGRTG